ncbi:MAG: SDR family oxidoreductase [Candidatus Eisenbacteria bacterium]
MNVLVTGASGYIGGRIVPLLLAAGHRVRCMARDPARLAGRPWPGVELVAGDALDPVSLDMALAGMDAAYYLIHSLAAGERGFEARDHEAASCFGAAAVRAGLKQVLYLGGLGDTHEKLSRHLRSRHETGEALRASGAPVTEFRAAVIVGSGSLSFEMIRYLTERVPVMITPRWVHTRCQPIAVRDVLAYLVAALGRPEAIGRVYEIGGPEVMTYGEMMLGYAQMRGLKRWLVPVPVLTPRLSSYWVDFVTPIPKAYARTLVEGLRTEVVVRNDSASRLFAIPATPYLEAVKRALDNVEHGAVETDWAGSFPASPRDGGVSLEEREGRVFERRNRTVRADAAKVFAVFTGIGGRRGWYHSNILWRMRGSLDRLAGGVGMRRGRRHPNDLRAGDALDFWRVESVEPGHSLRLRAEMKVPGRAWLVFEVIPDGPGQSRLAQTAVFEPRGLLGVLYWYALYPLHQIVFSGMIEAICKRAEAQGSSE